MLAPEYLTHTFSIDGNIGEFFPAPPPGALTQLKKPASSIESLSISPSTYEQYMNNRGKVGEGREKETKRIRGN